MDGGCTVQDAMVLHPASQLCLVLSNKSTLVKFVEDHTVFHVTADLFFLTNLKCCQAENINKYVVSKHFIHTFIINILSLFWL